MTTLKAEKRSMNVKAKKLRREGYVTGNLFGKKIEESIPVQMLKSDVEHLMKNDHKGSQILLDVDGQVYDVLIKDVEFNPMARRVDEVDFQALVSNEKVHSVAEVMLLNHEKVTDGVIQENLSEIAYRALPAALVDKVEIDLTGLKTGDTIKVKDLDIAKNKDIDVLTDLESIVVTVTAVHYKAEETEEETAEA